MRVAGREASLHRLQTRVLNDAPLVFCPFEELVEFLDWDRRYFAQAKSRELLASDADNESFELQQIAHRGTAQ